MQGGWRVFDVDGVVLWRWHRSSCSTFCQRAHQERRLAVPRRCRPCIW